MGRDILKLITSGAVVQFGSLLLLAIIGRQYSESVMGQIGLFLSWGGVLAIPAAARYEQAVIVASSERESVALYRLCLRIIAVYSGVLMLLVALFFALFSNNPIGIFVLALPIFVLLQGVNEASTLLILRFKHYNRLAIAQAVQGIGNNGLKAALGAFSPTLGSLIAASLLSIATSLALLLRKVRKGCRLSAQGETSIPQKELLRKWSNFPRYGIAQVLAETLLACLLVLILPFGYGLTEIGLVTMAVMLSKRPVNVLSLAVGKVFFQRLSERINAKERIGSMIRKLLWHTLLIGIPAAVVLWLLMEEAVTLVVGEKWQPVALVIRWMLPPMLIAFLTSILNVLPDILSRQRYNMFAVLLMLLFEASAAVVGLLLFDFESFIIFFCLAEFVARTVYLVALLRLAQRYDRSSVKLGEKTNQ